MTASPRPLQSAPAPRDSAPAPRPGSRPRLHWIDALRSMTVLLVILWHVFAIPVLYGIEMPEWVRAAFEPTYPIRLPFMVMLAGMFLPMALSKPLGRFYAGKVRNLAWPYAVWFVITALAMGNLSVFTDPWALVGGPYHLWFLAVLFCAYLIAPITRWVPYLVMTALMLAALTLGDISTNVIQRFLFWGAFFFAGAFLWGHKERIGAQRAWFPAVALALGVAGLVFAAIAERSPTDGYDLVSFAICLPWTLLFLWIGPRLPRLPLLEAIGRNNIVWYLSHFPAMGALTAGLLALDSPAWLIYTAGAVVSFGVPWLIMRWRRHVPWLFAAPQR